MRIGVDNICGKTGIKYSRVGVGVTKAMFVNFSDKDIFDLTKVHDRFFESLSYLTGVTTAKLPVKYECDI